MRKTVRCSSHKGRHGVRDGAPRATRGLRAGGRSVAHSTDDSWREVNLAGGTAGEERRPQRPQQWKAPEGGPNPGGRGGGGGGGGGGRGRTGGGGGSWTRVRSAGRTGGRRSSCSRRTCGRCSC